MSVRASLAAWRSLGRAALSGLTAEPLAEPERRAFHAELASRSTERLNGFAWLLFVLHVALLVRDLTLDVSRMPAGEAAWARWLFGLHMALLLGAGSTLLALWRLRARAVRARVAFAFLTFLLVWAGVLAGADQLIGAGITVYLMMTLSAALFVTFKRGPTAQAFALGLASFVAAQLWFSPSPAVAFSQLVNGGAFTLTCVLFSRMLYATKARDFAQRATIARQHAELDAERARTEQVLFSVLPPRIAERLRRGEGPIADTHPEVTVLFADLAGFTHLAAELPAAEMIEILNELFSRFDQIMAEHRLEKIKTVGDAYLAARGMEQPLATDVAAAADAGLALQGAVLAVARRRNRALSLRVGIARGVTMAGVLGHERLSYDVWGDAVNTASRLETAAAPGEVLVTEQLASLLADSHELGPVKVRELKGKGNVATRAVVGPRAALAVYSKVP